MVFVLLFHFLKLELAAWCFKYEAFKNLFKTNLLSEQVPDVIFFFCVDKQWH